MKLAESRKFKRAEAVATAIPILIFCLLICAARTPGQSAASRGGERIILCTRLVAAKAATLAVVDANGKIVPGAAVGLSDGEQLTTDESGRAHFLAPPEKGVLIARIAGTETRAVADVMKAASGVGLWIETAPAMVSRNDRFSIRGAGFGGDADRNRVEVGGQAGLILAASPIELVAIAGPDADAGSGQMRISAGGEETSAPLNLIGVSSTMDPASVRPGKKTRLTLRIQGTQQALRLEVRNLTPEVVNFGHGEHEIVKTSGGAENAVTLEVKGRRSGEFDYSVHLILPKGAAEIGTARDFVAAAMQLAPVSAKKMLARIDHDLRGGKPNLSDAEKQIEKLRAVSPAGDYQAILATAEEALQGQ